MLSFDVIIFHGQQMLSFLYYFPLNIFCVIFMLSFEVNINDNTLRNYTTEMITFADFYKKITSRPSKMITFTPEKW